MSACFQNLTEPTEVDEQACDYGEDEYDGKRTALIGDLIPFVEYKIEVRARMYTSPYKSESIAITQRTRASSE